MGQIDAVLRFASLAAAKADLVARQFDLGPNFTPDKVIADMRAWHASDLDTRLPGYWMLFSTPSVVPALRDHPRAVMALDRDARSTLRWNGARKQLITDGDSLTFGQGASDPMMAYPAQLGMMLGSSWGVSNIGVRGQTIVNMEADAAATVDVQVADALIAWGGTNDFSTVGMPPETVSQNIATYCQRRRSVQPVIVLSMLPRASEPSRETGRQFVNTYLRLHWTEFADGFVDVGANPLIGALGAQFDPDFYADAVHLNDAGYMIVASMVKDAVDALQIASPPSLDPHELWVAPMFAGSRYPQGAWQ